MALRFNLPTSGVLRDGDYLDPFSMYVLLGESSAIDPVLNLAAPVDPLNVDANEPFLLTVLYPNDLPSATTFL